MVNEVTSIQYRPHDTCEEVWAFLGWDWEKRSDGWGSVAYYDAYHDDEACEAGEQLPLFLIGDDVVGGEALVKPSDWIVKAADGVFSVSPEGL